MSVSSTVAKDMTDLYGLPQEKLITQHYGLEPWVLDYQRPPQRFTFISNRAWVENSNLPLIAEALREFAQEPAVVIGTPALGNETLGERIRAGLREQKQIQELGSQPYDKNIELVAASRFLLSWTWTDGTPTSVIEAMAVGTIPIVSDTAPNREWVEDGVNGILVPLDDLPALYRKVEEALHLPESKIQQMVARNKLIVQERASLKTNMGRFCVRMRDLL
jgi:glycosyltransferase involved in cell wall biosynthesis